MKRLATVALCLLVAMSTMAQTENPRGIYKMMTLIGRQGEIKAPYVSRKTASIGGFVSALSTVFPCSTVLPASINK